MAHSENDVALESYHVERFLQAAVSGILLFERVHKDIEQVDFRGFDLIVALHPDEATEPALRAAVRHDVDFAVVPCCVFPHDGIKRNREEWVTYLAALAPGTRVTTLPISGANIVL